MHYPVHAVGVDIIRIQFYGVAMQIQGVLLREVLQESIYRSIAITGNLVIVKMPTPKFVLVLGIYIHDISKALRHPGIVVKVQTVTNNGFSLVDDGRAVVQPRLVLLGVKKAIISIYNSLI